MLIIITDENDNIVYSHALHGYEYSTMPILLAYSTLSIKSNFKFKEYKLYWNACDTGHQIIIVSRIPIEERLNRLYKVIKKELYLELTKPEPRVNKESEVNVESEMNEETETEASNFSDTGVNQLSSKFGASIEKAIEEIIH